MKEVKKEKVKRDRFWEFEAVYLIENLGEKKERKQLLVSMKFLAFVWVENHKVFLVKKALKGKNSFDGFCDFGSSAICVRVQDD